MTADVCGARPNHSSESSHEDCIPSRPQYHHRLRGSALELHEALLMKWGDKRIPVPVFARLVQQGEHWIWVGSLLDGEPAFSPTGLSTIRVRRFLSGLTRRRMLGRLKPICGFELCCNPDHLIEQGRGKSPSPQAPPPNGSNPMEYRPLEEDDVATHRKLRCESYDQCLDYICVIGWGGWTCKHCQHPEPPIDDVQYQPQHDQGIEE